MFIKLDRVSYRVKQCCYSMESVELKEVGRISGIGADACGNPVIWYWKDANFNEAATIICLDRRVTGFTEKEYFEEYNEWDLLNLLDEHEMPVESLDALVLHHLGKQGKLELVP